jgi:hypothetical protein
MFLAFLKRRITDILEHQDLGAMSLVMPSLEAAHHVLHPLQKTLAFPWKHNLVDQAHHPQFMSTSLRIRDGERDQKSLDGWVKVLKTQERTNPLVLIFENLATRDSNVWNEHDLDVEEDEVWVVDFPSRRQSQSKGEVLNLFMKNVSILISRLLCKVMMLTYEFSAQACRSGCSLQNRVCYHGKLKIDNHS